MEKILTLHSGTVGSHMLSKVAHLEVGSLHSRWNVFVYFRAKFNNITDALKKLWFFLSQEWDKDRLCKALASEITLKFQVAISSHVFQSCSNNW